MSEMEYHKGVLRIVELNGKSIEDFFKEKVEAAGVKCDSFPWDSYQTLYGEEVGHYYEYVTVDGVLYKVDDTELDEYGFIESELQNDNSITYFVGYYNGGAGFGEILEDVVSRSKEI